MNKFLLYNDTSLPSLLFHEILLESDLLDTFVTEFAADMHRVRDKIACRVDSYHHKIYLKRVSDNICVKHVVSGYSLPYLLEKINYYTDLYSNVLVIDKKCNIIFRSASVCSRMDRSRLKHMMCGYFSAHNTPRGSICIDNSIEIVRSCHNLFHDIISDLNKVSSDNNSYRVNIELLRHGLYFVVFHETSLNEFVAMHLTSVLANTFPRYLLNRFATSGIHDIDNDILNTVHRNLSVCFIDIVGWTTYCRDVDCVTSFRFLRDLYCMYDDLVDKYILYRVETVGDCYVVVSGFNSSSSIDALVLFCKELLQLSQSLKLPDGSPLRVRIGINSGDVCSGFLGHKTLRFVFTGNTMNLASRMQSTCDVNCIQMSVDSHAEYNCSDFCLRKGVFVKGYGIMDTYVYLC